MHGRTIEEQQAKEICKAQTEIKLAYEEYAKDPFHIPSHSRYLFTSRSLTQRLQLDIDSMQCWLRSYRETKLTQQDITRKYAEASKKFFQPRHKPILTLPPIEGEATVQPQPKPDTNTSSTFSQDSTSSTTSLSITKYSDTSSTQHDSITTLPDTISIETRGS